MGSSCVTGTVTGVEACSLTGDVYVHTETRAETHDRYKDMGTYVIIQQEPRRSAFAGLQWANGVMALPGHNNKTCTEHTS